MKLKWVAATVFLLSACSSAPETGKVSKAEYEKLEKGMSYEEVQDVVGGVAEKENPIDESLTEYTYATEDGTKEDANVSLLFKNGSLDTIIDTGLLNEEPEDDRKLLQSVDYQVMDDKDNDNQNAKNIRVKLPNTEEYLYTFTPEDAATYIAEKYEGNGYDAIWIYIHAADETLILASRYPYTQKGVAMTGADEIGQLVTE